MSEGNECTRGFVLFKLKHKGNKAPRDEDRKRCERLGR